MDHEDFKGFGYKTCLQKIALTKNNNTLVNTAANVYTHSYRLSAAYDFSIMAYTNYTWVSSWKWKISLSLIGINGIELHSFVTWQIIGISLDHEPL